MAKANIKYIIFDLDDTLYPQTEYTRQCLYNSYSVFKKYFNLEENIVKKAMDTVLDKNGIDYKHTYDDIFGLLNIKATPFLGEMLQLFKSAKPNIKLFKNAKKTIENLKAKGFELGMITDGPVAVQKYKLNNLGIEKYFTNIIYTDLLGVENRKPSVLAFDKFLNDTNLKGENCIYVGNDPRKDFLPAKKSGMYTIRIIQGEYKNIKLSNEYEADMNIFDIIDLLSIVGE